jgi:hypothetical protein
MITLLSISCQKGLDPIISVPAKEDRLAPVVEITFPSEGKIVRSTDSVATITFKAVASDDIELKTVTLQLDGAEIAFYSSFIDYRREAVSFDYPLGDGSHTLTVTAADLTDKSTTQTVTFKKVTVPAYTALDHEVLYFSFDGSNIDLISGNEAATVGTPGYAAGKIGDAYAGATDSYLTYPADLITASPEFSVAFWYKINATPLRAGVMAISEPTDPAAADRTKGFRFLRENNGSNQNIGINFGIGTTEVWMNPFITVPPDRDWMHIAVSISSTFATVYVDGVVVDTTSLVSGIDWTGCTSMTIASGAPNFVYWEHFSDLSLYDEMHVFTRAITEAEVQTFFTQGKK